LCRRLREAEQIKSDFLSNVRNEINNPLSSILGLTSQMKAFAADEKLVRLSELVHQEVFQLDFQMRNIVAASEVAAGQITILASNIDIASFIEAQIQYLKPKSDLKNIIVTFSNACSSGQTFSTDASLLQLILANLLANAIEYSAKNSPILLKCIIEKESLHVSIQDFGAGIDSSSQKKIFEHFRQLDNGLRKEHRGQGLGLSIVMELVSLLGGEILCDSFLGFGTTMTIRIPELAVSNSPGTTHFGNEIIFGEGEIF
jgi:signal transduction histidine kinase